MAKPVWIKNRFTESCDTDSINRINLANCSHITNVSSQGTYVIKFFTASSLSSRSTPYNFAAWVFTNKENFELTLREIDEKLNTL